MHQRAEAPEERVRKRWARHAEEEDGARRIPHLLQPAHYRATRRPSAGCSELAEATQRADDGAIESAIGTFGTQWRPVHLPNSAKTLGDPIAGVLPRPRVRRKTVSVGLCGPLLVIEVGAHLGDSPATDGEEHQTKRAPEPPRHWMARAALYRNVG